MCALAVAALLATPSAVADPPTLSGVPSDMTLEATSSSGALATWTDPTASDGDGNPTTVECSPASGSTFPLGTTTVTCTATDTVTGDTTSASFTVTVQDTTPPTVTVPGATTAEASGPSGVAVTFSASASDVVSGSLTPSCSPASGSTFPLGSTSVTCTATDGAGNSGSASFTVTVQDTTPPTVTVPGATTAEASGPSGVAVTFSASASDVVSGSLTPSCSPASGSTFPLGSTSVTCTATDGAGNSGSASFTVTVQDTTPPVLSGVPANRRAEADGASGSRVSYPLPTAVDTVSGPVPVGCAPPPGSLFPLGDTAVGCSAADGSGNVAGGGFTVTVVDTTAPTLNVPRPVTLSSSGAATLSRTDQRVRAFLRAATARDIVDGPVPVENNAPDVFPLGKTEVTFTAGDKAGNRAAGRSAITVVRFGAVPPAVVDRTPPADVKTLRARAGDRSVELTWVPPPDAARVEISRSPGRGRQPSSVVFSGPGSRYLDRGLLNGVEYRYVVVAVDAAGNRAAGVAIRAVPKKALLFAPAEGAVVTAPPLLRWAKVAGATYYNVQLYRVRKSSRPGTAALTKILSAWPDRPELRLQRTWTFDRKRQRLTPGRYVWFVWPGFGPRAAARYGDLLGQSTFTVSASA